MFSCRGCATLYTSALPDAAGAQNYDEYYDAHNLSVPDFIHLRLAEIVAGFAPYRRAGRLLDIGCGAGTVLEAARRAGWEAEGVEVSRPAVEHLRARGFAIFHGELAAARYPENHFDVVIASEVIEHLADPRDLLREAARVLRPGGLLWATTPHSRGASARALGIGWSTVCPPEHLHLFSRRGLKNLLREAGFSRVRVATHGVNPYEILAGWRGRAAPPPHGGAPAAGDDAGGNAGDAAGDAGNAAGAGFNRVESSYSLNESLNRNRALKTVKGLLNAALNVTRLGDSLKITAEK
jgi:SAM-dependent methyltransferase